MFFHEVTDGFTVYYSTAQAEHNVFGFQINASINPFNYASGGVECSIKVMPKNFVSNPPSGNHVPYEVISATRFCSSPKVNHVADMQMAFIALDELGKKTAKKIKTLLPEAGDYRAVLTALSEKDYVSVMVLMEIRDFNEAGLAGKGCDEWLKNIVSHKSFRPILDSFREWDRTSTIKNPELQMCTNFAAHLNLSDRHRGCHSTKKTSLDDDFGKLFNLAGVDYSIISRSVASKKELSTTKDQQADSELPWKMK